MGANVRKQAVHDPNDVARTTLKETNIHDQRTGIPYGIAISLAALQVYPQSIWFQALT